MEYLRINDTRADMAKCHVIIYKNGGQSQLQAVPFIGSPENKIVPITGKAIHLQAMPFTESHL
jgi:hypothetical protein